MRVWMVHSELDEYSDLEYDVEGVFSTKEKALDYVMSREVKAYHFVGTETMEGIGVVVRHVKELDYWSTYEDGDAWVTSSIECVEESVLRPRTTDGHAFFYFYPDGNKVDCWEAKSYFIDEFAIDSGSD